MMESTMGLKVRVSEFFEALGDIIFRSWNQDSRNWSLRGVLVPFFIFSFSSEEEVLSFLLGSLFCLSVTGLEEGLALYYWFLFVRSNTRCL